MSDTQTMYRLYGDNGMEFGIFATKGEAQEKYEDLKDTYPSNFRFFIKPTKVKKHAHGIQRIGNPTYVLWSGESNRRIAAYSYKSLNKATQAAQRVANQLRIDVSVVPLLEAKQREKAFTVRRNPTMKHFYEVIVSNIGKVYEGSNYTSALRAYGTYVRASKSGRGKAGNEQVMLWKDNDPVRQYIPETDMDIDRSRSQSKNPAAKWIPATAVRMLPGGKIQVKVPRGSVRNPLREVIDAGPEATAFYNPAGAMFRRGRGAKSKLHPIRAWSGYSRSLAGEKPLKRRKATKKRKAAKRRRR